jgi:hypothetical protein
MILIQNKDAKWDQTLPTSWSLAPAEGPDHENKENSLFI